MYVLKELTSQDGKTVTRRVFSSVPFVELRKTADRCHAPDTTQIRRKRRKYNGDKRVYSGETS